jgi:prolyl-tRNA synthetase
MKCGKGKLVEARAIELGHVFKLGTLYSESMKAYFTDEDGRQKPIVMGCYGIGMTRVMAAAVEVFHDDKGILWPVEIAPYQVHLISLSGGEDNAKTAYELLREKGIEVLWDDRTDVSAGVKFADADLIGIPWRLVISQKTGDRIEVKKRNESSLVLLKVEELIKHLR